MKTGQKGITRVYTCTFEKKGGGQTIGLYSFEYKLKSEREGVTDHGVIIEYLADRSVRNRLALIMGRGISHRVHAKGLDNRKKAEREGQGVTD